MREGEVAGLGRWLRSRSTLWWVVRSVGTVQDGSTADVITCGGHMFRTKSRKEQLTEQLQDQREALACTTATVAEQLR